MRRNVRSIWKANDCMIVTSSISAVSSSMPADKSTDLLKLASDKRSQLLGALLHQSEKEDQTTRATKFSRVLTGEIYQKSGNCHGWRLWKILTAVLCKPWKTCAIAIILYRISCRLDNTGCSLAFLSAWVTRYYSPSSNHVFRPWSLSRSIDT